MGKIINLQDRLNKPPDNLISLRPWEFRRADWETVHFIQMSRAQSVELECHREENYRRGIRGIRHLPPHFLLKRGMDCSVRAMYAHRDNEERMRQVYYLMGLMDCMINRVNPILRTDVLRGMYKKVSTMRKELDIHWHGPLDEVLLRADSQFYDDSEYRSILYKARTMNELYRVIRQGTDEMFDIFSREYVFYCPGRGG